MTPLAKFILVYICFLLGRSQATAQLDFGTYKIINQATESSLCSDELGQPIYVSTPGYSCHGDRELWQLGPGDEYGLYTIKNMGLNSGVQANTSGLFVVTSNNTTSVAIVPTEGYGHIVKFHNSDFVWTAVLKILRGEILLQPEGGDKTQIWTFRPIHDTIRHRPSTQFNIQARNSKEEERNLEFLRGIERLGGSAGYLEYLESSHATPSFTNITALTSEPFDNHIHVTGFVQSLLVYSAIEITADGYNGTGYIWGAGFGAFEFGGTLTYDSLEELTSEKNSIQMFYLGVLAGGILIQFFINGNQVAYLKAFGVGVGVLVGDSGTLTWTKDIVYAP
jgi:hypothetical protein